MPLAEWFFSNPGSNKYDISEAVRRSFWFRGFGMAWFDATKADPPYVGQLEWRDQLMELEWEPRQFVILRLPQDDPAVVDGLTSLLGFKPAFRYQNAQGHTVVEWRKVGLAQRQQELAATTDVRNITRV